MNTLASILAGTTGANPQVSQGISPLLSQALLLNQQRAQGLLGGAPSGAQGGAMPGALAGSQAPQVPPGLQGMGGTLSPQTMGSLGSALGGAPGTSQMPPQLLQQLLQQQGGMTPQGGIPGQ